MRSTSAEELKCPDSGGQCLVSYEDVTSRVQGAAKQGASDKEANEARNAQIAAIEKESTDKTGLRSEVVALYRGGEYWLYRFKKYTDIRLVFAPEEQIAFFGGDYDNFTYPRYCLDVTFLRVYENGQPLKTQNYLKWSAQGPADGEFVLAIGNPGSTNRLLTLAQVQFQRDVGNPLQMQVWNSRREALLRYGATGPEACPPRFEHSSQSFELHQAAGGPARWLEQPTDDAQERAGRKSVTSRSVEPAGVSAGLWQRLGGDRQRLQRASDLR